MSLSDADPIYGQYLESVSTHALHAAVSQGLDFEAAQSISQLAHKPPLIDGPERWDASRAMRYAAHAVRHAVRADPDRWPPAVETEVLDEHMVTLINVGPDFDVDDKTSTGLLLLRAVSRTGAFSQSELEPARLFAKWLAATGESQILACGGQLARWIISNGGAAWTQHLGTAWWSLHGDAALDHFLQGYTPAGGRPTDQSEHSRQQLSVTVRGIHSTGDYSKSSIAQRAGISRPTLDSWLGR